MKQKIDTEAMLAHLLQSIRKQQRLTQSQLGQRAGISQERYSVLEKYPGRITVCQLMRFVSALGLEFVIQEKGEDSLTPDRASVEW
jgi:transcriptional regulator with XRE-family HTH domain